jgi:hypothetical protein
MPVASLNSQVLALLQFNTNTTTINLNMSGKKLISIEEDSLCMETYPCRHGSATFTYSDGTTETRGTNGHEVLKLCTENNIPLPDHFAYMKNYKPPFSK